MRILKKLAFILSALLLLPLGLHACATMAPDSVTRPDQPNTIRFASFNIHYVAAGQKKLDWDRRKEAVVKALREIDADIIGFQEMETFAGGSFNLENKQLDWILQHLPEYAAGAYGNAEIYPNTQPVLYRKTRFEQKEQGFFFFSDTPEVIYSRTYNGSWPAFCSWSALVDRKNGSVVRVYNIHFEYKSMSNRSKSAALVSERVTPIVDNGNAVVLLGDVNAFSFFPTTRTLESIPLSLAPPAGPTYHFNRGLNVLPAIDHLFYSRHFEQIGPTRLLRANYDGIWPTDHYPVVVDLEIRKPDS